MHTDLSLTEWLQQTYPHLQQPGPEIVAEHIRGTFLHSAPALPLGRRGELIVLAVDGIAWEILQRMADGADLGIPYRSTFPSTSLVSWLTAIGVTSDHHPVPGPVFALEPAATANLISDHQMTWAGATAAKPVLPPAPAAATVFEQLGQHGLANEVFVGDFFGINESWISQLSRGATRFNPSRDLSPIRMAPIQLAEAMLADLRHGLADRQTAVRWAYFNFDDRIHRTGYDSELLEALSLVVFAAERWACDGYSVLLHSDHGHIRNTTSDTDQRAWAAIDSADACVAPAGGAGRVRWLYPRPGLVNEVAERLHTVYGDRIGIFTRDSQHWRDLAHACGNPTLLSPAVGDVIAVALDHDFPVPDPRYVFEHGSLCADEMNTGALAWIGN